MNNFLNTLYSMSTKTLFSFFITLVLGLMIGFFIGRASVRSATPSATENTFNGVRQMRQGGAGNRGGFGGGLTGDVIAKDANSLTVQTRDGSSHLVFFATSTRIGKFVDGALADIAPSTTVMVVGSSNPDGSMTATQIQIRGANDPVFGGRPTSTQRIN
jgi:hypothetical protein